MDAAQRLREVCPALRDDQVALAEKLVEAMLRRAIPLAVAPTGWGKTLPALCAATVVAEELGRKQIVLAVHRRNQIVHPGVSTILRFFPCETFAYLWARSAMCPYAPGEGAAAILEEEACAGCGLKRWGDLSFEDLREAGTDVWRAVELCLERGWCPYYTLRRLLPRARFVILHHLYVFEPRLREAVGLRLDRAVVVVDECHGLDDLLGSIEIDAASLALPRRGAPSVREGKDLARSREEVVEAERAGVLDERDAREWLAALDALRARVRVFSTTVVRRGVVRLEAERLELPDPELVKRVALAVLQRVRERARSERRRWSRFGVATWRVAQLLLAVSEGWDLFLEARQVEEKRWMVLAIARSMEPSRLVEPTLDSPSFVGLLMSASPPSEEYIRTVWGVRREIAKVSFAEIASETLGVPIGPRLWRRLGWGYSALFIVPTLTSSLEARSEETYRRYAEAVEKIVAALGRGIHLFVFPSRKFMEEVLARLSPELVAAQTQRIAEDVLGYAPQELVGYVYVEPQRPCLEEVRRLAQALGLLIVFAVARGRLVEGIEIVDQEGRSMIRSVVLCGAPYPEPDEYLERFVELVARRTGRDRDEVRKLVLWSRAAIATAQALGRAVRSPRDAAILLLLDHRFARFLRYVAEVVPHRFAGTLIIAPRRAER